MAGPAQVDIINQALEHYKFADAAARGHQDFKAIHGYQNAIKIANPVAQHAGDAFAPAALQLMRSAQQKLIGYYNYATKAQLNAGAAIQRLITRDQRGEAVGPEDGDIKSVNANLIVTRAYLSALTHDAQGKVLQLPDALYWLAYAYQQQAQIDMLMPALQGASVALPDPRKKQAQPSVGVTQVPAIQDTLKAMVVLDQAREQGLDALPADPADPNGKDGKTKGAMLEDAIRAAQWGTLGHIYAGAIAALSPATNPGPKVTENGNRITGPDALSMVKVSAYAQMVRASRNSQLTTAEALRESLERDGVSPEQWKKMLVDEWDARVLEFKKQPDKITPKALIAVNTASKQVHNAAKGIR